MSYFSRALLILEPRLVVWLYTWLCLCSNDLPFDSSWKTPTWSARMMHIIVCVHYTTVSACQHFHLSNVDFQFRQTITLITTLSAQCNDDWMENDRPKLSEVTTYFLFIPLSWPTPYTGPAPGPFQSRAHRLEPCKPHPLLYGIMATPIVVFEG